MKTIRKDDNVAPMLTDQLVINISSIARFEVEALKFLLFWPVVALRLLDERALTIHANVIDAA